MRNKLHLTFYFPDPDTVAKDWQKRFACSVSVSLVPGFLKDREIIMQGSVSVELENHLTTKCNIPRDLVVNKAIGKKKKNGR